MNKELSDFASRLREMIGDPQSAIRNPQFSTLALQLFALQFQNNPAYQKICRTRKATPKVVEHWTQIPAVPTSTFKELEFSCIPTAERAAVFHSSGTTEQKPSRHFHCPASLELYETSLWQWFERCLVPEFGIRNSEFRISILTPPPEQAPHSSLIYMFEAVRQKLGGAKTAFVGKIGTDGAWSLDFDALLVTLNSSLVTRLPAGALAKVGHSSLLFGTAFSFVHLLDFLVENNLRFNLPAGSRVMETGGYKNRSRSMPKAELHALITERLGVLPETIVCEYGMSELSSQAYDSVASDKWRVTGKNGASRHPSPVARHFQFPPWARAQIISPETGREVSEGETGLIHVFDLANVFSVMAIQTEDLAIRRGDGFELIGRAQLAEPRGCSLMTA